MTLSYWLDYRVWLLTLMFVVGGLLGIHLAEATHNLSLALTVFTSVLTGMGVAVLAYQRFRKRSEPVDSVQPPALDEGLLEGARLARHFGFSDGLRMGLGRDAIDYNHPVCQEHLWDYSEGVGEGLESYDSFVHGVPI